VSALWLHEVFSLYEPLLLFDAVASASILQIVFHSIRFSFLFEEQFDDPIVLDPFYNDRLRKLLPFFLSALGEDFF